MLTIVYFESGTLRPVLKLLWHLNVYTYHCACNVSLQPMHISADACDPLVCHEFEFCLFNLFQFSKDCCYGTCELCRDALTEYRH